MVSIIFHIVNKHWTSEF